MTFRCKNIESCSMFNLISTSISIMKLQPFVTDYCMNAENHVKCARFRLKEEGEEPGPDLLPDSERLQS